jgi:uncharacterized membrane protein
VLAGAESRSLAPMLPFLSTTVAQVVIWTTALLMLTAVGYYVVRRFRDRTDDDRLTANQMLTKYRELQHRGDISDAEYRTIKTVLGEKLQQELNNSESDG